MPFSARGGFLFQPAGAPPPAGDIVWYEYDRANYEPISQSLTGGTVTTSTFNISGFSGNDFRYRGGVLGTNGNIYCAPRSSGNGILEIDPVNKTSQYRAPGALASLTSTGGAYFHSAVLLPSGNILCVPFNHDAFIQFDPVADTATEFGTINSALVGASTVMFSGAVLAENGNVICLPLNANCFLDVDPVAETVTTKTYGLSVNYTGGVKFFGGARSYKDDCVYAAPLDYGAVVRINTVNDTASQSTYGQTIPANSTNQSYGMASDLYGNLVFLQGETGVTSKVVDPDSNTAFTFNLGVSAFGAIQGGDGNVYSTTKSSATKKIDLSGGNSTPTLTTVYATTSPNRSIGVTALNGNTYIFPEQNSQVCLEIDTSSNILSIDNSANVILSPYMNPGTK